MDVDVIKMYKETNISVSTICAALGIPSGKEKRLKKKIELAIRKELDLATTFEKVFEMYGNAPRGSKVEAEVLEKALDLATTLKEILRVYHNTRADSKVEARAVRKISVFFLKKESAR